ncbi:uncharacterized protein EI90DRAFT_3116559 [Cantharellus anzutake]|uniref:uncharacterized protein n=1 Tax=Cantharellus anzutake TaxID=1750568 RepID=UPI0019043558|nr:uncharacterized protein EI90DRAFT_3116559 [Cantharellus anzutake]KAF8341423.1 hypothetical protein EI90DRAFT_3116559 [Cantharellus anzutake]
MSSDGLLKSKTSSNRTPSIENAVSHIMTPGSSLDPTFILLLDCSLGLLLSVFVLLLIMSKSLHFVALIAIELGLWASVKLYVAELRKENEARSTECVAQPPKEKSD